MSDERKPVKTISFDARLEGKKLCRIEIFKADLWRYNRTPLVSKCFCPRVPSRKEERDEYFNTRYRVRIDGAWYQDGGQYTMLTRAEMVEKFLSLGDL